MNLRDWDIMYLQGVGPKKAELIKKEFGIRSVYDLLYVFPYKYIDRSKVYRLREIQDDTDNYVQVIGTIIHTQLVGVGKNQRMVAQFTDGDMTVELVWFAGWQYLKLQANTKYLLFGKPAYFNHQLQFTHPELQPLATVKPEMMQGLEPHYNTSGEMKKSWLNSKMMRKIMYGAVQLLEQADLQETLSPDILNHYHFLSLKESLKNVHFPANAEILHKARERLKFEELFYIQLQILKQTKQRETHTVGLRMPYVGTAFNDFYFNHLPFPLTNAQKRVIKEIQADLKSGKQMNRLLQGDVGSGKTLVALMVSLLAKDNGFQTCIMAPTEILAQQHYETLTRMFQSSGVEEFQSPNVPKIALLTGTTTKKQREILFPQLLSGEIDILIGTHALIEDNVQFANLGLAVIDEQHRFGVAQRAKLWSKNINPPHILVMTATPIPRTLAMTVYGDLAVSVIDELPPGRKPIHTVHYYNQKRDAVNRFMLGEIAKGRQVYVVYPLIEENKKLDLANLQKGYEYLTSVFPTLRISMVHGKMRAADKEREMQAFASGQTQILVATTVIEVGVNVPNASVMIVENAERFGLSQLHQLRGRVGRGAEQSYCVLMTNYELSKDTRKRIEIMTATNDGFRIAEADLQLRGPGDLEGTQQSGIPFELKIASLATDGQMLELARNAANDVLNLDPDLSLLQNKPYADRLAELKPISIDWGEIS